MQRGETGRYEVTSVGGEQVRAFVPFREQMRTGARPRQLTDKYIAIT
jgi:hypothetical protein